MVSADVKKSLQDLEDPSDLSQNKSLGYKKLLDKILFSTATSPEFTSDVEAFINTILGDNVGVVAARPLLGTLVESIKALSDLTSRINAGTIALRLLESRVVSFEDQDAQLREMLADAYILQEEYVEAAKVLQGIQLESSQRRIPDDHKLGIWIRICRLYLEEDDITSAESYLNRAKNLRHKVSSPELILSFQLSEARILDARRKFLEASQAYHNFSFSPVLDEEERTRALSSAITCAVLSPAGPSRSRALARLYKDERAPNVPEFGILEKMFLDRLLSPDEIFRFSKGLPPHQLAQTADGSTVLAKAVTEHNLLSISKLYDNVGIDELASLLGLPIEKAESYAARMLGQGRIAGNIDQVDRVISFHVLEVGRERVKSDRERNHTERSLGRWDARVQGVTEELERVASMIQLQYPVIHESYTMIVDS
ncbi:MAG: hypothetical protein Q9219_002924 [cf. Caloplaca sp. 3 TL-2023]